MRWKRPQGPWVECEHKIRAMPLREKTLKEFWEIFVDDRPFGAESINRQVNVQSKAVFSYAVTLMDKIRGWEDEESWVGPKFAACMWSYTKEAFIGGQILDREQEEYLRKRIMSIRLCTNWVCAGASVDDEWVSSRTIIQQEEEILSTALDFKIDAPCVVQWSLLWFSAPINLNRILGSELKLIKYHEVVNSAIMDAIVKPFTGKRTPKSCMLTSVARVLQRTHKKRGINEETKGWRVRENFTPSSSSDGDDDEEQSSNE